MTTRLYYMSRDLTGEATITTVSVVDGKALVELNQTLFAPKGGGQQCDLGTINGWEVEDVRYQGDDSILHILSGDAADVLAAGRQVSIAVDANRRELNSCLHTAGHLIAQVAEQIVAGSMAVQGHHWPGESRVELIVDEVSNLDEVQQRITKVVNNLVKDNRMVHYTDGIAARRTVTIEGFGPIECGGTHVASLDALGTVELRGTKWKKGRLRIGYDCR